MKGYQAGISKFTDSNAVIFGISTDDLETQTKFAKSLDLEFALLSDNDGAAAKAFGILNERNMASRTTFVIDREGKIQEVISGGEAIAIDGAVSACSRLK